MSNSSYKRLQRLDRIESGLCTRCGTNQPRASKRLCPDCAEYISEHQKTNHQRLIDAKVCIRCKKSVRYQRYKICQECRHKELNTKRKVHEELGLCKNCGKYKPKNGNKNCPKCITRTKQNRVKQRIKNRQLVLDHYGRKCSCPGCGETIEEFLTIDHIDGSGAEHRKEIGKGAHIYSWLVKHDYPSNFRILCFNCNCVRNTYGYCPHESKNGRIICANKKDSKRYEQRQWLQYGAITMPHHMTLREAAEAYESGTLS